MNRNPEEQATPRFAPDMRVRVARDTSGDCCTRSLIGEHVTLAERRDDHRGRRWTFRGLSLWCVACDGLKWSFLEADLEPLPS